MLSLSTLRQGQLEFYSRMRLDTHILRASTAPLAVLEQMGALDEYSGTSVPPWFFPDEVREGQTADIVGSDGRRTCNLLGRPCGESRGEREKGIGGPWRVDPWRANLQAWGGGKSNVVNGASSIRRGVAGLRARRTPGNARLLSGSRGRSRVFDLGRVSTRPASQDDASSFQRCR